MKRKRGGTQRGRKYAATFLHSRCIPHVTRLVSCIIRFFYSRSDHTHHTTCLLVSIVPSSNPSIDPYERAEYYRLASLAASGLHQQGARTTLVVRSVARASDAAARRGHEPRQLTGHCTWRPCEMWSPYTLHPPSSIANPTGRDRLAGGDESRPGIARRRVDSTPCFAVTAGEDMANHGRFELLHIPVCSCHSRPCFAFWLSGAYAPFI
jgi:hypothetical protein